MAESKGIRFLRYFPLLLDALRSKHPEPMRPAEAAAWIRSKTDIAADDLSRKIKNGDQTIYVNDVHWARFYLAKANLICSPKRGLWALTEEGAATHLTPEKARELALRIHDETTRTDSVSNEDEAEAPGAPNEEDEGVAYWFAGASWNGSTEDQLPRFLKEGIWENGYDQEFTETVRSIKPGDRIAIKSAFVQKRGLPFDVGGKSVSVMRIKAVGLVLENPGDGKVVRVAWDKADQPRDWYFYTYRTTLVKADPEQPDACKLIDFAFRGIPQDYQWFLKQPYWVEKYGERASLTNPTVPPVAVADTELLESDDEPSYTVQDIVKEGSFLPVAELSRILDSWKAKKNLVLQGPPGTGKTWLAKRLAFALIGSKDRDATRSRLRVVQFHPSLGYEDFVRGWRPSGDGKLRLEDGILMQAVKAALSEPDSPFVLVIEEINRGNPAQIFGEMLTLLENSKRNRDEAIELAYRQGDERVHVPENLYVIGTMNVADRSLAIVDLALRRRFAFFDLEPMLGAEWRGWCKQRGLADDVIALIESRIADLNEAISTAPALGKQFRIGHSYVTPDAEGRIQDGISWFRARVETEIAPLLAEYWYDAPERARREKERLVEGLA